ncbi:MAG: hypothetical protein FWE06_08130 [Oscillospiraceae bacterium]|nr:hypothetical protein [Oscillospiraceae bacterium]
MAEIIKVYKESMGAKRFIGKKYGDSDRVNGTFGAKWCEWFSNGWFDQIEDQIEGGLKEGDGSIGLMRGKDGAFEYWIGYFTPENTIAPDGFDCIDFPKSELGVCWVYGKDGEVYFHEGACADRLKQEEFDLACGDDSWCFERYVCPRFTVPDDKGNIILDICFLLK